VTMQLLVDISEHNVTLNLDSLEGSEMSESSEFGATPLTYVPDDPKILERRLYFINERVEHLLRLYIWTSCTNVALRDSIMGHATELINQIIRKQNLHLIYPGQDDSAFGDLVQTAWVQIERTLYKFRAKPHCRVCYNPDRPNDSALYLPRDYEYGIISFSELFGEEENELLTGVRLISGRTCPHCSATLSEAPTVEPHQGLFGGSETVLYRGNSKVFNMWSQVARTVILAFVKKEGRDRKNADSYRGHLHEQTIPISDKLDQFFLEASELCKYNSDHMSCVNALRTLVQTDSRPYDGLIAKLIEKSGLSRSQVSSFVKMFRLRSHEFSASPINKEIKKVREDANSNQQESEEDEY